MSELRVVPVNDRSGISAFIAAGRRAQSINPHWVEPLHEEIRMTFSPRRSPFLRENVVQPFVAFLDGEPVGRIVATIETAHLKKFGDGCGFFGFIERPRYGFFVDHSVDAINNLIFAIGLGLSPYVSMEAAIFLLCSYYLISINVFPTAQVKGEFRLSHSCFGPTELRLLVIVFNCLSWDLGGLRPILWELKLQCTRY